MGPVRACTGTRVGSNGNCFFLWFGIYNSTSHHQHHPWIVCSQLSHVVERHQPRLPAVTYVGSSIQPSGLLGPYLIYFPASDFVLKGDLRPSHMNLPRFLTLTEACPLEEGFFSGLVQ